MHSLPHWKLTVKLLRPWSHGLHKTEHQAGSQLPWAVGVSNNATKECFYGHRIHHVVMDFTVNTRWERSSIKFEAENVVLKTHFNIHQHSPGFHQRLSSRCWQQGTLLVRPYVTMADSKMSRRRIGSPSWGGTYIRGLHTEEENNLTGYWHTG